MSVYALADPRDGRCRYVGRSARPRLRFATHLHRPHSKRLRDWMDELRAAGLTPELRMLDGGTEREWIVRLAPDLNARGGMSTPERPPKAVCFTVWVDDDQEDLIKRAAAAEDEDKPSVWIRKLAVRTAKAVLGEGGK